YTTLFRSAASPKNGLAKPSNVLRIKLTRSSLLLTASIYLRRLQVQPAPGLQTRGTSCFPVFAHRPQDHQFHVRRLQWETDGVKRPLTHGIQILVPFPRVDRDHYARSL